MIFQNKYHLSRKTLIFAIFCLMLAGFSSCKKDPPEPAPIVIPPKPDPDPETRVPDYLKLLPETAHALTVTQKDNEYHFAVTTTEHDPYAFTGKLANTLHADSVVLCFEYKSSKNLEFIQVFFAEPITEARSVKTGNVAASNSWKKWSVVLKEQISNFSWGKSGDYLRLDFGNDAGYTIELRNIYFRAMNAEEKKEAEDKENKQAYDKKFAENLTKYLSANYTSSITEVNAGENTITVRGNCSGSGSFKLCEIPPWLDVTQLSEFEYTTALAAAAFEERFERFVVRDGITYDRTLSKWAIVDNDNKVVSHARYPDNIYASQATTPEKPSGKKGLGGYFNHGYQRQDLDDMGITSVTVNVPFTGYMYSYSGNNRIAHSYGGKTWYFDRNQIENLDNVFRACSDRNIVVAAIVLVQKASDCPDQNIGATLQHPDFSTGYYTMPNMTTQESVNMYAAGLDFLASRYCRADKQYGRIHHWIMHNEVDAGYEWTNMGADKPMMVYTDTYMKSMRMCYNIARQYDQYSEVFGSFTHSWKRAVGSANYYATADMLNAFNDYCSAEGDFQWALAYHCYPQDLTEPKTWNDSDATYSTGTGLITFKNLEVLSHWAKQPKNFYKGETKRTVWLSENGTNSRSYEEKDLLEQAAGFAWGWKKLKDLDGIDAMQWHNWADNEAEFGLRIGLRKFSSYNLEKKDVWYAYQAAGTDNEDTYFAKYLPIIGISDWNILKQIY